MATDFYNHGGHGGTELVNAMTDVPLELGNFKPVKRLSFTCRS